jgi:aspartate aminotransferase
MVSARNQQLQGVLAKFNEFASVYDGLQAEQRTGICDFAFGNPHELPLPEFGATLQKYAVPQNKDWFGYKMNERASQEHVARSLQQRVGIPYAPEDVCMTNGAAGALNIALATLLDPGDEVIINLPPWFFYEAYIIASGGVAVKVKVKPDDFDLDVEAIRQAITTRTRAVIVNSPNNPTGKIYPPETLRALGEMLSTESRRVGRTIYLISDEAYSRILFDGRNFASPTGFYADSILVYTYGKTLLTPGQRLGYLALAPTMAGRQELRYAMDLTQVVNGWAYTSALMQYSMPDLEKLCIDMEQLQHKRNWMVHELSAMGYQVGTPEGTFYLLVKSPLEDDTAFTKLLAEKGIYCLPGSTAEIPGYFRISLTANEDMIRRSMPGFLAAIEQVGVAEPD